ncbi:hypothetical protein FFJ24_007880 [Pedobacter sp. KBS0701]|nr:hypothetical protein FFJ24_007880 [Pedobacter sp. KBS0701]
MEKCLNKVRCNLFWYLIKIVIDYIHSFLLGHPLLFICHQIY